MNKDVHTEHCCALHGCKYGDDFCPVRLGQKEQSNTCESCYMDGIDNMDLLKGILDQRIKTCPYCNHVLV